MPPISDWGFVYNCFLLFLFSRFFISSDALSSESNVPASLHNPLYYRKSHSIIFNVMVIYIRYFEFFPFRRFELFYNIKNLKVVNIETCYCITSLRIFRLFLNIYHLISFDFCNTKPFGFFRIFSTSFSLRPS